MSEWSPVLSVDREVVDRRWKIQVIRLVGVLDIATAPQLRQALLDATAEFDGATVVVDFERALHVGTVGWGTLIGHVKRIRSHGGEIRVSGLTGTIESAFRVLGLQGQLRPFR